MGESLPQPFLPEPASIRGSFNAMEESPFPPMADATLPVPAPSIAPVRLRRNAAVPALNRGVYSSWERESVEDNRRSVDPMSHLGSMMTHSTKYESVDLLRLLKIKRKPNRK